MPTRSERGEGRLWWGERRWQWLGAAAAAASSTREPLKALVSTRFRLQKEFTSSPMQTRLAFFYEQKLN